MSKASVTSLSRTQSAQQRRQTQAVELCNAQQPRAQKLVGGRLWNERQTGMPHGSGAHTNVRAPLTDCMVVDNYLERRIDSAELLPVLTFCLT